jgi:hypothetical protein
VPEATPAPLFQLGVLGAAEPAQVDALAECLSQAIGPFGLQLGKEVAWSIGPDAFSPSQRTSAAIAYFGTVGAGQTSVATHLKSGIPVLPVVSTYDRVHLEIPAELRPLNCLAYNVDGPFRIATALLECVGLLRRQRRVFVSYRRSEARDAAVQLFDALSAHFFDVFLDTHGIAPAEDFQSMLWHRLCDSDVLIMLDTPGYFESRWSSAEFGRALAKQISVLSIGWPGCTASPRTATASRMSLSAGDIDAASGRLGQGVVSEICNRVEALRSQSLAVRNVNIVSNIRQAVELIGGTVLGVGIHRAIHIGLPDGTCVVAHPALGVPTSLTLQQAADAAPDCGVAVVYDHVGLHSEWLAHLNWLGSHIQSVRWIKATEAAWDFADWAGGNL